MKRVYIFKTVILQLAVILVVALLSGCAMNKQLRASEQQPDKVPSVQAICSEHLEALSMATTDSRAMENIRAWLNCFVGTDNPPPTMLKGQASAALKANPYPGTRRHSMEILSHFFDRNELKNLPEMRRNVSSYITMLDDQGLVAKAEGDLKFAAATEKRAKSLSTLSRIIDMVDEGN